MSQIILYTASNGHIQLEVNLAEETVWLTQKQMADLFDKNIRTISEHIVNIFAEGELAEDPVIRNFRITAADGKTYDTKHYNLDVVISVGYRVKSKQGTAFRQWATNVLKDHLIKGYTVYKPRLAQQGLTELQQTIELLQRTLQYHDLINDVGSEVIQLILNYAKTWSLLLAYDEKNLRLPSKFTPSKTTLNYEIATKAINTLKTELIAKQEATSLFGIERSVGGLNSILNNIEQTFDSNQLYKSTEEKAAHLLYFIIKDHPYADGNKRIGCFIFLLYLRVQNIAIKLNDNGLLALALLVAESEPSQKDILIKLIINILTEGSF